VLADGAAPSTGGLAPSTGGLTEEDLRRLGSGLAGGSPPQIQWTEAAVNAACERGRAQGGVTDAEGQAHFELAGDCSRAQRARSPGRHDLAAAVKRASPRKVDPQRLDAAARTSAPPRAASADRLRKALDSFQTLARIGAARLTRREMGDELWAAARVPAHALQKLSDSEVARVLQQVTAAVNGGPGSTS
jgi:hypothetical protein